MQPMSATPPPDAVEILLVEDNQADVVLAAEVLAQARIVSRITVARDGEQAMAVLRGESPYEDAPRPDLILLDLNLPRMDGREVLAAMKADPVLRRTPVVVLTSSEEESDVLRAYDDSANAYVVKPIGLEGLAEVVKAIDAFWFSVVRLPSHDDD